MDNNVIANPFTQAENTMTTTYELKLKLTAQEISEILDYRLGQKIEHESDDIESLLNMAECIKSSKLSDEFCRFYTSELNSLVTHLISSSSDSYEITNFQHRMLRKFTDCPTPKKQIG